MNKTVTLIEFLESTGAKIRIFDMGRRLTKISRDDFLKFENHQLSYPYPLQQQAWFALSMTNPTVSNDPVIWFLRFPLDETGKLVQAGRDYFIHRLIEASATAQQNEPQVSSDALKDNPHIFKPRDDKMAVFHARLSSRLKQPPSRYYDHAREYLTGSQGWEQWNFVGLQGIADIVERLSEQDNEHLLSNAINKLPQQPLEAVCQCLENIQCPHTVAQSIVDRAAIELSLEQPSPSLTANLIRAISNSKASSLKNHLLEKVMHQPLAIEVDIVTAIAARCWEWLADDDHARLYLEKLAQTDQDTFNHCLTDLLFMPGLRNQLLAVIRSPERSDRLAKAFGHLMKNYS